ncbi:MAG: hypothetical protein H5T86_16940, partial [Armatimonadetes bacterium]|nr:hypothetical protein [Armatimonadota bacterium]
MRQLIAGFMCAVVLGSPVILAVPSQAQSQPRRVAVITSSGVNNDCRSFREYDATLAHLGWPYDKFRNTELGLFFQKAHEYDMVLTTSLWNYGDPQDMAALIPNWNAYMKQGGVLVLTDMAYPPMCDWLKSWDSGLAIEYADAVKDAGPQAGVLDLSSASPFLTAPYL